MPIIYLAYYVKKNNMIQVLNDNISESKNEGKLNSLSGNSSMECITNRKSCQLILMNLLRKAHYHISDNFKVWHIL